MHTQIMNNESLPPWGCLISELESMPEKKEFNTAPSLLVSDLSLLIKLALECVTDWKLRACHTCFAAPSYSLK